MDLKVNNNLNQIRRWRAPAVEVLVALITAFVIWLAYGVNQLGASQAAQTSAIEKANQLESRVEEMEDWVDDWYNILRVPERDENQDAQILEFRRRINRLEAWRDSVQE